MASRGNPNVPSKLRKKANRSKVQKRNAKKKDPKSGVFYPTSGSAAPLSGKKAKKLARAQTHARRRGLEEAMAKEGEVFMTGNFIVEQK